MKLASLNNGSRDGLLIVVDRSLRTACDASAIALTLQAALDDWSNAAPALQKLSNQLNENQAESFKLDLHKLMAPLPRAYQFVDGSAYLAHVERVRKARGAEMPPSFLDDPLMYQAASDRFLAWHEDIVVSSEDYGIDFESEVVVVTDDVPMAVSAQDARRHIQLIGLINDVSLRALIPAELKKNFGFLHGKPHSALAPVLITPDELGVAWSDAKVQHPLLTHYNGQPYGHPEVGVDMQFDFGQLIAHAAKTRPLAAGTVVGSGTVANQDESKGSSCLAEQRMLETIRDGKATTPFMKFGDRVRIEMRDEHDQTVFGAIDQQVVKASA